MWAWWDFSYPVGTKPSGILYGIPDVLVYSIWAAILPIAHTPHMKYLVTMIDPAVNRLSSAMGDSG